MAHDFLVQTILDVVLEEHAAEVTSYDAGDFNGCACGEPDARDWASYRAHLHEVLSALLGEAL